MSEVSPQCEFARATLSRLFRPELWDWDSPDAAGDALLFNAARMASLPEFKLILNYEAAQNIDEALAIIEQRNADRVYFGLYPQNGQVPTLCDRMYAADFYGVTTLNASWEILDIELDKYTSTKHLLESAAYPEPECERLTIRQALYRQIGEALSLSKESEELDDVETAIHYYSGPIPITDAHTTRD